MAEDVWSHYDQWWAVIVFVALYAIFLAFIPFYRKSQRRPSATFLAFVVAFSLEMFGVPFSMYVVTWAFGMTLPPGVLWGHTLEQYIGDLGVYANYVLSGSGIILVVLGWREIHRNYWSKEKGEGKLVTNGLYAHIRHPQYTGFLLVTLGMLIEWATIPLLIMWPILALLYYRLAKKEEADMKKEFGSEYVEYKKKTSMFIPFPKLGKAR